MNSASGICHVGLLPSAWNSDALIKLYLTAQLTAQWPLHSVPTEQLMNMQNIQPADSK